MMTSLNEIEKLWTEQDKATLNESIVCIADNLKSRNFFGLGVGRMGLSLKSFIMRLSHLGGSAFFLGDTNLPSPNKGDIVIINSSSGKTPSLLMFAKQAKEAEAFIILYTHDASSPMALLSNLVVRYKKIKSRQFMKTLPEQYSYLLFDYVFHEIVKRKKLDFISLEKNHSIFE